MRPRGGPGGAAVASDAAVGDSAPREDAPVARAVNGLGWQLAKSSPLDPDRGEVGVDAKAAIEIRTVDAPPAPDIALIALQFVQTELGAPAAGRAGWHRKVHSGPVVARSDRCGHAP